MAHKKAGGSSSNGRDSIGKRLGVKKYGGESVIPGNILIRQRGNTYWPGKNVGQGNDFTLFAKASGHVVFKVGARNRTYISIEEVPLKQQNKKSKKEAA